MRIRKPERSEEPRSEADFEIGFYRSIIDKAPNYVDALSLLGDAYTRKGLYREGLDIDRRITSLRPDDPIAHYNLACSYSLLRMKKEALQSLRKSIALGYSDLEHLATDNDLAFIRRERSFHRLVRLLCRRLLQRVKEAHNR